VCPTDPSSFLYKCYIGHSISDKSHTMTLEFRTIAGTLASAVLLHGTMLKERDKGTLASQMADVKEN
jgi:hypothetical protein